MTKLDQMKQVKAKAKVSDVSDHTISSESEDFIHQLLGAVYLFKLDPQGHSSMPFASDATLTLIGLERSQLSDNPLQIIYQNIAEEDRERFMVSIRESAKNLTPWRCDFSIRSRTGIVRTVRGRSLPFREEDGSVLWNGFFTDITEEMVAKSALARHRRLLHRVENLARIGGWEFNPHTNDFSITPGISNILEIPPDQKLTLDETILFCDEPSHSRIREHFRKAIEHATSFEIEFTMTTAKGHVFKAKAIGEPKTENGEVTVIQGFVQDITYLKLAEEAQIHLAKMDSLSLLASGIAHDFNNYLGAIMLALSLAETDPGLSREMRACLNQASNVTSAAQMLTRQLLLFAREGPTEKKALDPGKILVDTTDFCLHGSGISCLREIEPSLYHVEANSTQLQQVIHNIVLNARQAMNGQGTLWIKAKNTTLREKNSLGLPKGRYVEMSVKDSGPGITGEIKARIFDPYFTTKTEGNGLGLATAYTIIRAHEGTIICESENGTTFTIYLPAQTGARSEELKPKSEEIKKGKGNVLLLDDNENVLIVLSSSLARLGYTVATALSSEECVKIFREAKEHGIPFDAVILDMILPGEKDGVATYDELKKIDPNIKAILSTGIAHVENFDYKSLGFLACLPKPFNIADLSILMEDIIRPTASDHA